MENTASYTALRAKYGQLKSKHDQLKRRLAQIEKENIEMKQLIQPIKVSPDKLLIKAIQSEFELFNEGLLKSRSRKREIVLCRQIFHYVMTKRKVVSPKNIALFSGHDRSTTIHSYNTICDLIDWDKHLREKVERIERLFVRYYGKG